MSRSGSRYYCCLSERERRLDPEHGGSRFWCYVFARVFCGHTRRTDPAFDKAGSDPGSFTGLDLWPLLVTRSSKLRPRDSDLSLATDLTKAGLAGERGFDPTDSFFSVWRFCRIFNSGLRIALQ